MRVAFPGSTDHVQLTGPSGASPSFGLPNNILCAGGNVGHGACILVYSVLLAEHTELLPMQLIGLC